MEYQQKKCYCDWARGSALLQDYHDREWGVPVRDDRGQFEHLMLESLQCGLSWSLILKKREIIRSCFENFDYERIACYTEADVERIANTEGMLRSVPKIRAVIHNAKCFLEIRREFGSFTDYIWGFAGGKTILYHGHEEGKIPVSNGLSQRIAKDLKKRGFRYVGGITVYSHLQACGIINDHDKDCPCYGRINRIYPTVEMENDGEVKTADYRQEDQIC